MHKPWMPAIPQTELDASPSLQALVAKLEKKRAVPKVNLPALARRDTPFMSTWVADPGTVLVSCDFSSLEPSLTAHFSQDPYYRYATYDGIKQLPRIDHKGILLIDDVYLMTASVMPSSKATVCEFFRNPDNCAAWVQDKDQVLADKTLKLCRSRAKPACLGFNYGMGWKKFVMQSYDSGVVVTASEAKAMYTAYWGLFAGIKKLTQKLEKLTERDKAIVNPFGYRLTPEPRKAYNAFIQSSASGVVDVYSDLFFRGCGQRGIPVNFIMFCHDEVVFSVKTSQVLAAKAVKEESVLELNQILGFSVPMRLNWVHGESFAAFK